MDKMQASFEAWLGITDIKVREWHNGLPLGGPGIEMAWKAWEAAALWMNKEAEKVVPMDIAPRIRKLIKEPNA